MNNYLVLIAVSVGAITAVVVALILAKAKRFDVAQSGSTFNPEQLLSPIREQISTIVSRLDATSDALTETRTSITKDLGHVLSASNEAKGKSEELALTTERLSTALQGNGVRGNWGQISLRRVAEMAGLTKHVTFSEQVVGNDDRGKSVPDMVVKLPGNRTIVVDAKAPKIELGASGEPATAKALKIHIDDLVKRDYGNRVEHAIDFTVLFVPSEGVMATALTEDQTLSEYAFKKSILLATPMTLLSLLRAVEFGWKQSEQMDNVEEILKETQELCNRFGILSEHFEKVGDALTSAVGGYNDAVNSFNSRLVPQVRVIGQLEIDTKRGQENLSVVTAQIKR